MAEFEGQEISEFIAAIPGVKLEAEEGYARGTYLDLKVQVRVRSVRYEEIAAGKKKGDLVKVHVMAIENVEVAGVTTPEEHRQQLEAALADQLAELVDENGQPVELPDGGPVSKAKPQNIDPEVVTNEVKLLSQDADEKWEYSEEEVAQQDRQPVNF